MSNSNIEIDIKIDDDLKQEFEEFCEYAGISVSTAINLYVRKCLHANKILVLPNDNDVSLSKNQGLPLTDLNQVAD